VNFIVNFFFGWLIGRTYRNAADARKLAAMTDEEKRQLRTKQAKRRKPRKSWADMNHQERVQSVIGGVTLLGLVTAVVVWASIANGDKSKSTLDSAEPSIATAPPTTSYLAWEPWMEDIVWNAYDDEFTDRACVLRVVEERYPSSTGWFGATDTGEAFTTFRQLLRAQCR
jgi:hypothetical protein